MGKSLAFALSAAGLNVAVAKASVSAAFATPALRAVAFETRSTVATEVQRLQAEKGAPQQKATGLFGGAVALASLGAVAAVAGKQYRTGAKAGKKQTSAVALRAGPKVLEGTGGPFPHDFWDPAGLTKNASEDRILYYRASELKHGRTAMLAVLGWFHTAAGWHPIGDAAARTVVSDDPLIAAQQIPLAGWLQVVFFTMVIEWLTTYPIKPPAKAPWDLVGWSPIIADEEYPAWKQAQLQEINNGRLAMVAIIGLIAQDAYTGKYFEEIKLICGLRNLIPNGQPTCEIADKIFAATPPPYEWPALYPHS